MASKPALIGVAVVAAAGIAFGAWYGMRKAGPAAPTAKPMADDVAPVVSDGLAVQFVARSAGGDRALADGAAMKAGEAIRIRARSREAGYLLIARIDRLGGSHLVYPAGRGGQAAPMKASPDLRDLGQDAPAAVGDEVFVSLLCSRPFVFGALQDKLRPDALTAPLLPGCAQTVQRVKAREPGVSAPLPEAFFARDALDVAHDLIGRHLRHEAVTLRITEVEAYRPGDSACHGFRGESARNRPLFGPPGRLYVYVCYGIHRMVNVVTGPEGEPQGVLIRACAPVEGLDVVAARRGGRTGPVTLTGPGKIGAALALDVAWSGHPVFEAGGVEVLPGAPAAARLIGPRVGIDYAEPVHRDAPWRVAEADSRWVSVRKTLRPL